MVTAQEVKDLLDEVRSDKLYLISYDVKVKDEKLDRAIYQRISGKITGELEELGAKPVLKSQWVVRSKKVADKFCENLTSVVGVRDRRRVELLVTHFNPKNSASHGLDMSAILRQL